MKFKPYFLGKNKKNISLPSAEPGQRVVKVKDKYGKDSQYLG